MDDVFIWYLPDLDEMLAFRDAYREPAHHPAPHVTGWRIDRAQLSFGQKRVATKMTVDGLIRLEGQVLTITRKAVMALEEMRELEDHHR